MLTHLIPPPRPALLACLLVGAACFGRADTVILSNGDRLTGEIQKLEERRLELKTDYAGVLKIDWRKVERISTAAEHLVETGSGLRLSGLLRESPAGLEVAAGEETRVLALANVVRITPVREPAPGGFWRDLTGAADIGYSLTRGNSVVTQSSVSLNSSYRAPAFKWVVNLTSLFSRQLDAPSTSWHTGSTRLDLFLTPRAFAFSLAGLERDERQLLNLRATLGGGLGWKLLNSERYELSLLGGANFLNEDFRRQDPASPAGGSSGEALLGLNLEKARFGRLDFWTRFSVHPNVVEAGRYRMLLDSGVRLPVISRFTWSLRLFDRFNSDPPPLVKRNDYGLISSLGVTF